MRYLILIMIICTAGCHTPSWNSFPQVMTRCRHEVLAQRAALEEMYPNAKIQIVGMKYFDEDRGRTEKHVEVRIWLDGEWKYLHNKNRIYHFWGHPGHGVFFDKIVYDNGKGESKDKVYPMGWGWNVFTD
jgi:hypothetical protein